MQSSQPWQRPQDVLWIMETELELVPATMAKSENARLPRILLAFAPLHRMAMGVAGGTVLSSVLFLATLVVLIRGGSPPEPNLGLLSQFLFGYRISLTGSI